MRSNPLNQSVYIKNREKFMSFLKQGSIAVFHSNDVYPISADTTHPFKQSTDLLYLTGIDQEDTILLMCPNSINPKFREVLFIRKSDHKTAVWEGEKLSRKEASEISGISSVYFSYDFEYIFSDLAVESEYIYINTNEHYRQNKVTETKEDRFIKTCKLTFPVHCYQRSAPIMHKIRGVKESEEIDTIKRACDITSKGFMRVLKFVKPNIWEYQIEAEYIHEFINNRAQGFAYDPIIASGNNATILHYIKNNAQCKDGALLLMDVGCRYNHYASDMTRTIPVNGRYSQRQKKVYNAVLEVKKRATQMLKSGVIWAEYHIEVGKIMTSVLLDLGLLDQQDIKNQTPNTLAYKKYFMHGTSHHLGLDTHDYGELKTPMKANMVFTVEPGIYIPQEKMGIRLEDDVVIQEDTPPINLMKNIPIEIEEIEYLMNT